MEDRLIPIKPSAPVTAARLLEHPESRRRHGLALVWSDSQYEYVITLAHPARRF